MKNTVFGFAILIALSGCSLVSPCAPFSSGSVEMDRCNASLGKKADMREFARALETGAGVEKNEKLAAEWYRRAAMPTATSTAIYVPPVGRAEYGSVMNVGGGPAIPGDAEAMYRLGLMYRDGRGVKQSPSQARDWLDRAKAAGYLPGSDLQDLRQNKVKVEDQ